MKNTAYFWLGTTVTSSAILFLQAILGKDAYLNLLEKYWIPWYISSSLAILNIVLFFVLLKIKK